MPSWCNRGLNSQSARAPGVSEGQGRQRKRQSEGQASRTSPFLYFWSLSLGSGRWNIRLWPCWLGRYIETWRSGFRVQDPVILLACRYSNCCFGEVCDSGQLPPDRCSTCSHETMPQAQRYAPRPDRCVRRPGAWQ